MKINLLDNGIDSLKKGFEYLTKYEESYLMHKEENDRFYILKDAILFVHHGIEILFKEILKRKNELLIFSNIDKSLKKAFSEKRRRKYESLFDANLDVHTVSLIEAADRLRTICGVELSKEMLEKVEKIQNYRNKIMHSEVSCNETEISKTFSGLVDELDTLFLKTIGNDYQTITGYGELKNEYEKYIKSAESLLGDVKNQTISTLMKAFDDCSISIGQEEWKYIDNIDKITKLFSILFKSDLNFGMDMYNLHCSGEVVSIKRKENNRFCLYAVDNVTEYLFKMQSILIFMPSLENNYSPIIFIEADEDEPVDNDLKKYITSDSFNRKVIEGLKFVEENRIEWRKKDIYAFYRRIDYDDEFLAPQSIRVLHFLSDGLLCAINVQSLKYGNIRNYIQKNIVNSLKDLEVLGRFAFKSSK